MDDDVGKYLAGMKPYEFWKLVRKHRQWLTTREAAAYLGIKARTLESWRWVKGPPPVQKGKLIHYHIDVLDAWMVAKTKPISGSDEHTVAATG